MFLFLKKLFKRDTFKAQLIYEIIDNAVTLMLFLVPIVFLYFIQITPVNSGSMYPTMNTGDISIQTRIFGEIERFDIVTSKIVGEGIRYEKRIIGLPGETIEIINGVVFIDDEELNDPYAFLSNTERVEGRNMEKRVIPKNEYFIVGDNRDFSHDSREIGTIHKSKVWYRQRKLIKMHKLKKDKEQF